MRNPELVWNFYQGRRRQLLEVVPNPAHSALVTLEKHLEENLLLITQNVDDLHARAGSVNLIHMHGELCKLRCESCEVVIEAMERQHLGDDFVGCSDCVGGRLRPHIVWFNEMPLSMDEINRAVFDCDVFIAIGTSGHVYPAAGLLGIARIQGAYCIGVNLDPPENVGLFDEFHQGKAGELLPDIVAMWIGDEEE